MNNSYSYITSHPVFDKFLKALLPKKTPFIYVDNVLNEYDDIIFLDAREKHEFEVSHIENAIHIGFKEFDLNDILKLKMNKKIVVYCSIGWRSGHVGNKMLDAGIKNVYNLYGGIFEWCNAKQNLYRYKDKVNQIHIYSKHWGKWVRKGVERIK
ncbi:MAG: rhodanese-like domain-containing protein [Chitinophagaceae bacterium]